MEKLSEEDLEQIRQAVERIDIAEAIEMAERMGIIVSDGRGWHRIKDENGEWVPLDIEKHMKLP